MYTTVKALFGLTFLLALGAGAESQTLAVRLAKAHANFESDPQLSSAISSITVLDAANGNVLFQKNGVVGLAPASTQKVITAATAYAVLGNGFRYKTTFGYYGGLINGRLAGSVYIKPSGDPTLGSWRWAATNEEAVVKRLVAAITQTSIQTFGSFVVDAKEWEGENIPGGWIWDDVANYYGAGAAPLNWRENQYDLILKSGANAGDAVSIVGTKPVLYNFDIRSAVRSAAAGTGDNAYIYFPVGSSTLTVRGTIPVNEQRFTISGAMPSAQVQFLATLTDTLSRRGINKEFLDLTVDGFTKTSVRDSVTLFHTETSPPLDSTSYWFLKRSINLYGEALLKTIAEAKGKPASTDAGVDAVKDFWKEQNAGFKTTELSIQDGSGLSPLNRTTTNAQARVLWWAKSQPWFGGYLAGFPEFNGMKLKSGTIQGAKSFCGYHTSTAGRSFIVSFIVNGYNGSSSVLVQKMYKVLDVLK